MDSFATLLRCGMPEQAPIIVPPIVLDRGGGGDWSVPIIVAAIGAIATIVAAWIAYRRHGKGSG